MMPPYPSCVSKTDLELLADARSGDREAFAEIVRRHETRVRSFLSNFLFDNSIADDLAQDVFLATLTQLEDLQIQSSLRAWLLQTARYKAIDFLRHKFRHPMDATVELDQVVTSIQLEQLEAAENEGNQADRLNDLQGCLGRLRPRHRELIESFYFEGSTAESIAMQLGQSAGSVRMALTRIRKALAECMKSVARMRDIGVKN